MCRNKRQGPAGGMHKAKSFVPEIDWKDYSIDGVQGRRDVEQSFLIDKGMASGDIGTISIQQLSALIRASEVNGYAENSQAFEINTKFYDIRSTVSQTTRDRSPKIFGWLLAEGVIQGVLMLILFLSSFSRLRDSFDGVSSTIGAAFVAHTITYLVVWGSTGFKMYMTTSIDDGLNLVTRASVKIPWKYMSTFPHSGVASSISSSVSSRGTSLNKLMIGVGFSIGLGCWIKFIEHNKVIAFSYLMIIATSIYENRTFPLKDGFHLQTRDSLHAALVESKRPTTYENQLFLPVHSIGVFFFILLSFVGFLHEISWNEPLLNSSLVWSVCGLLFGVAFVLLNRCLNATKENCWNRKTSISANLGKGAFCIFLELMALSCATAAGVVFPIPKK